MLIRSFAIAAFTVFACSATLGAAADAADITIKVARISAGHLEITGTTASPGTRVRLEGQTDSDFNLISGADGAFSFQIVYHPGDCIVALQALSAVGSYGAVTEALVADCGPRGVTPRGPWSSTASYQPNDLATYLGSTWRAKQKNTNTLPLAGTVWEQFAAAGAAAPAASQDDLAGPRVAPTGPAGGDLAGNYPNPFIAADVIGTGKLKNNSVTHDKIAANAIDTSKIAPASIGGGRLAPDTLTAGQIAAGAIGASELNPSAFFAGDISLDGGSTYQITTGGVDSSDLASGAVTGLKLGTITRVDAASAIIAAGGNGSVTATCPAGSRIITGGNDGFFDLFVVASRDSGNGWAVFAHNASGGNRTLTVHAYCLL